MNKKFANLQLHQMDLALTKLREVRPPTRPGSGWVKAIRESLGMSASALARKLGVTPASITKLEKAEADEKNGWVRYNPTTPSAPEDAAPVNALGTKRKYTRKAADPSEVTTEGV